jgi:hypothetical protein
MNMQAPIHTQETREEEIFTEFRRRIRDAEVLCTGMQKLLLALNFSGKVSVVVQNGTMGILPVPHSASPRTPA